MIGILIVTHGFFGQELLQTAQNIVGTQKSAVSISVTSETGIDTLSQAVEDAFTRLNSGDGVLCFVDMLGGTPCNTVMMKMKNTLADVVTGVNLYMLISAFTHRENMDVKSLAAKVAEDGKRAIVLPKDLLLKRVSS